LNWFGNKALVSGEKKILESMFVHNDKPTTTAPQMINVNPNGNLRKSQPGSPRREFTNPHLQQHQQHQQQHQSQSQDQLISPKRPTQSPQPQQQSNPTIITSTASEPNYQDLLTAPEHPKTESPLSPPRNRKTTLMEGVFTFFVIFSLPHQS
jgi:hypothetical protein